MFFAANWKMQTTPGEARLFLDRFIRVDNPRTDRVVGFFPSAVAIEAVAQAVAGRPDLLVGVQDVHWEPAGAFTGETSVALARGAGATSALVGHSERRHLFGETDRETGLKIRAVMAGGMIGVLCVGETLAQREAGETGQVVERQLSAALVGLDPSANLVVAYEPVWAIGTGRNATAADASQVHAKIRDVLEALGLPRTTRVIYGGSVKPENVAGLVSQAEIDGVLVGGASLDPDAWATICRAG